MVKSGLILQIAAKQTSLSVRDVEMGINCILEKVSQTLAEGGRVEIRGFGSFCLHHRPPRKAHNPKTGERVYTQAKYTPHFKPGKDLRERVNKRYGEAVRGEDQADDE